MSAPDTNTETQKKRHRGPLIGIAAVVLVAILGYFAMTTWLVEEGGVPAGADVVIDGRTGEAEPVNN